MKVLIAATPAEEGWTKFHSDANCAGLRNGEVTYGAEYVWRDLEDLPANVRPCHFECCFPGYATAAELRSKVRSRIPSPPPRGIRVGQQVKFRYLDTNEERTVTVVHGPGNAAAGELSKDTGIAKALVGHEPGEVVDVGPPHRVRRLEILEVT